MVTSNGIDSAVLKAKFGEDIRKTEIHHTQDLNFNDLVMMMQRFFQIKPTDSVSLKYRDSDNDWITLANDDDVSFALRHERNLYVEVRVDAAAGETNFSLPPTSPPTLTAQQLQKQSQHVDQNVGDYDYSNQKSALSQTPKTLQENNNQQLPPPSETPQSAISVGHQSQPLFATATPTYGHQPSQPQAPQSFGAPPTPAQSQQQLYGAPTPTFGGEQPPPVASNASHAQPPAHLPAQTFYSSPGGVTPLAQPIAAVPPTGGQLPPFAVNASFPSPQSNYQPQQVISPPSLSSAIGPGGYAPPPVSSIGAPVNYSYQPVGNNGYPPTSLSAGAPPSFPPQNSNTIGNPFARVTQPPGGRPPGAYYQ